MRIFTAVLTVLSVAVSTAYAQDAVTVDPKHYKVEFENEQVRVLRITYGAGEKSVMHAHPAAVAILLTDGTFRMTLPGGTTEPAQLARGAALWAPATTHLPENAGTSPAELILVELKQPAGQ
jgi:quercetin dioxygenase-like cupin family protein